MNRVHGPVERDDEIETPQVDASLLGTLQARIQMHQLQEGANTKQTREDTCSIRQHHMVCDNQSMVNKTNEISQYVSMYPNSTMASEFDVLAEIRTAMRQLGRSRPELTHIKGHQNETKPWHELTRSAQLNCRADELADQYLKDFPATDRTKVSILPTSGCQLQLEEGTVTYNLKLKLTHARTIPPLRKKLCEKNAWGNNVFHEIDWTAHGQALKRLKKHRKTLVQYVHDWLPVGKRIHKYDAKYPEWCPSCSTQVEDSTHLMTCPATS